MKLPILGCQAFWHSVLIQKQKWLFPPEDFSSFVLGTKTKNKTRETTVHADSDEAACWWNSLKRICSEHKAWVRGSVFHATTTLTWPSVSTARVKNRVFFFLKDLHLVRWTLAGHPAFTRRLQPLSLHYPYITRSHYQVVENTISLAQTQKLFLVIVFLSGLCSAEGLLVFWSAWQPGIQLVQSDTCSYWPINRLETKVTMNSRVFHFSLSYWRSHRSKRDGNGFVPSRVVGPDKFGVVWTTQGNRHHTKKRVCGQEVLPHLWKTGN